MRHERGEMFGRPRSTTHESIESVALDLFHRDGFEQTTVDDIATAAGISRRTLFRYFASKNDIPWGRFSEGLAELARRLDEAPHDEPVWQALHDAILDFNAVPAGGEEQHRRRMRLLLGTPALQAHSALMYAEWRGVIARFVAERRGIAADDVRAVVVGHAALGVSLAAYETWLAHDDADLGEQLDAALGALRDHLAE
ncbi:mycofactocin system transcriptional regulator [Nocardioides zeae]|uniref:Mycofactocin system transcriptional regulator n=1 Tax=Nocardioides zeae TaxID=1457234 RepID=A0ACC6ILF9_9ACTN|nr:mycofactocin system transcriptional regulator [Nocardioides zeae]MDR6173930.1 mycofactocin system transcriptional regulator [Nocardioides zeae]MDR6211514.1 mycofactocin system transcriptional regulator [Nocardioides zeae]